MKRIIAIFAAAAVSVGPAFSQVITAVYPSYFGLNSGEIAYGSFRNICESDDNRVIFGKVEPLNEIQMELGGYAPIFTGNQFVFFLETCNAQTMGYVPPVFQRVEVYNYRDLIYSHDEMNNWVTVDTRMLSTYDQLLRITLNAKQYINKNDGSMRVRVTWYYPLGEPAPHFHVGVDWAGWMFAL